MTFLVSCGFVLLYRYKHKYVFVSSSISAKVSIILYLAFFHLTICPGYLSTSVHRWFSYPFHLWLHSFTVQIYHSLYNHPLYLDMGCFQCCAVIKNVMMNNLICESFHTCTLLRKDIIICPPTSNMYASWNLSTIFIMKYEISY